MADHHEIVRPLNWSPSDLPSLIGKVALVTGANSLGGLGGNIAQQLALKGATVYVGARSLEKANAGIKAILAESPSLDASNLKTFVADVGDYKGVREAAEAFLKQESRLDILVNNAGILPPGIQFDKYGVNTVMGTNHLGHFLLTNTLLPLMEKTAKQKGSDVRIVNVSSTAHYYVPPGIAHFTSLKEWNNDFGGETNEHSAFIRYGHSKAANILFTAELQRRLDLKGSNILVTAPHPGSVRTNGAAAVIGKDSDEFKKALTPYEGALTPIWCAAHPEVREKKGEFAGKYIMPFGGLKEPTEVAKSEVEARGLWDVSENVLRGVFSGLET